MELELARLRKELVEVKLDRELLMKFRRISRRRRGEICLDRGIATPVPRATLMCRVLDV